MENLEIPVKKSKIEDVEASEIGILHLPNEILKIIFMKLPQYDVQRNLALVCKTFLDISRLPGIILWPGQTAWSSGQDPCQNMIEIGTTCIVILCLNYKDIMRVIKRDPRIMDVIFFFFDLWQD